MNEPAKQLLTQIGAKKGVKKTCALLFSLIYFFPPFSRFYINYVIPQAMPHAIRQTHSAFYPHRVFGRRASVERHLSRSSYRKTIFNNSDFKTTRDPLKAKQKQLKRHEPRKQTKSYNGSYGRRNWGSFWQKVAWIKFTARSVKYSAAKQHDSFGLRGCKEQTELRWGDIVLKADSDGKEYLEYFER